MPQKIPGSGAEPQLSPTDSAEEPIFRPYFPLIGDCPYFPIFPYFPLFSAADEAQILDRRMVGEIQLRTVLN
jgi:hypothetical protein